MLWQVYGIVSIGAFVAVASAIVWFILNLIGGLRPSEEDEETGLDSSEVGVMPILNSNKPALDS